MEIDREDADADDDDGEPLVATVDATEGIPTRRARDLARRLWYLGWFGLPLAWVYNAWMFWPHIAPDPPDASDLGLTAGVGDDDAPGAARDLEIERRPTPASRPGRRPPRLAA